MKKTLFLITIAVTIAIAANSQSTFEQEMNPVVTQLEKANTVKDYLHLATDFTRIAGVEKTRWLPYYYTAFCYAKIGWLKQNDDPDHIDQFASKADEEINKAMSLIDTSTQRRELSEIYCVLSMINRARVFINPVTYGRQYGPIASRYTFLAMQANPENPRALYLAGWEKYSTPKMWGGDKRIAKELLTSAKQKLTASDRSVEPAWGTREVDEILERLK